MKHHYNTKYRNVLIRRCIRHSFSFINCDQTIYQEEHEAIKRSSQLEYDFLRCFVCGFLQDCLNWAFPLPRRCLCHFLSYVLATTGVLTLSPLWRSPVLPGERPEMTSCLLSVPAIGDQMVSWENPALLTNLLARYPGFVDAGGKVPRGQGQSLPHTWPPSVCASCPGLADTVPLKVCCAEGMAHGRKFCSVAPWKNPDVDIFMSDKHPFAGKAYLALEIVVSLSYLL